MSVVSEVALRYSATGADKAARADKEVRESVKETSKTAESEAGSINRWMERNKTAIQAVAVAAAGAMGAIISASPTMRAELSGARVAFSLFADTIVNDVLPGGESLVSLAFDLEQAYSDLPDTVRQATSALILFGALAAVALVAIGPVAAILLVAVGAFMALSEAINPTVALLGATVILAGALLVVVGPVAAAVMLVVGSLVALSRVIGRSNALILAAAIAAGALAVALGVLSLPVLILIAVVAALALAWTNNWLGIRDIVQGAIDTIMGALQWLWDFISADSWRERLGMLKDLWDGFVGYIDGLMGGLISDAVTWGKDFVGGLVDGITDTVSDVIGAFQSMGADAANAFTGWFNDKIPSSIGIDSVSISVPDVLGGGSVSTPSASIDIPRLRHGGMIERGGQAIVHAGERIVPAAEVSSSDGGGGGGTTVVNVEQHIESGGSPRRTANKSADAISQAIQSEFGTRR